MSCEPIVQPGPDGFFVVPGISERVPQMPEGTCVESSRDLTNRFPQLRYQEGILVMIVDGHPIGSVHHAWNVGPNGEIVDTTNRPAVLGGKDVAFTYLPNDEKHERVRQLVEAIVGAPEDYTDDPLTQDERDFLIESIEASGEPED